VSEPSIPPMRSFPSRIDWHAHKPYFHRMMYADEESVWCGEKIKKPVPLDHTTEIPEHLQHHMP